MSRSAAPEVATPQVMAETLAAFYSLGGLVAVMSVWGGAHDWPRRVAVTAIGLLAIACGAVLSRHGHRFPRGFFHGPVAAGTVLISLATFLSPGPVGAVVCAAIMTFVGVVAHFFFRRPLDLVHLGGGVTAGSLALVARGDVLLPTAVALHIVVLALGIVVRRLVSRASDASLDALTGLANRRGFDERLQAMVARPDVLSAALIDLDHFKQVNDTLGHQAGDRVLRRVADTWQRELPASAVLARHGGDEFALLLPGTTGPQALALVDRLRTLHPDIGLSIGVAQAHFGESAAQLMRRADTALYAAKAAGRGRSALQGERPADPPTAVPAPRTPSTAG